MRGTTKLLFACMFFLSTITYANAAPAEDENIWLELNKTSDKVLQLVREEKLEEAKQLMTYFSKEFLAVKYNEANVSMSDLRVVTTSFENAMAAVTNVSMTQDERVKTTMEFRLAIDALSTDHNPLWLKSRKSVMQAISNMKTTAESGETTEFQNTTNEFLRQYKMIRPAIMVDLEAPAFQRIESHVQYIKKYRADILQSKNKTDHLTVMEKDFNEMYDRIQKNSADPSLLWVMLTIGGMIVTSLSYTGWKKYKAEKRKVKMGQGNE